MRTLRVVLVVALALPASGAATTSRAGGSFIAQQECELYQSKRKKTNPGGLKAEPDRTYAIREAITKSGTVEWLRVETGAAQSPLRWISADCGETRDFTQGGGSSGGTRDGRSDCSVAEQYDSHVLAISWQPAFCELKSDKKECRALNSTSDSQPFVGSHFALHGLWPNKEGCGTKYGFCGTVRRRPGGDFCNYPEVDLSQAVRERLGVVMPSVEHGTCLERHEWWKHGTCRANDAGEFYALSLALLRQINESSFVTDFIESHIGAEVQRDDLHEAFDAAFGSGAHRHIRLICGRGLLNEIQLQLPKDLRADQSVSELLFQGQVSQEDRCSHRFEIDALGLN